MAKAATKAKETGDSTEETFDIDALVENPRNPNQHPEEQLLRLMASLRTNGQYKPVIAARRSNRMADRRARHPSGGDAARLDGDTGRVLGRGSGDGRSDHARRQSPG